MITLRDYQLSGDEEVRQHIRAGRKRVLVVAGTGSGKGTWAADLVRRAVGKGKRVIFAVYGREIVEDFSRNRLDKLGVDHGVIMADHPRRRPWLPVHVASIDTLRRRTPPPADLLIVDECDIHFSAWLKLRELYPQAVIIGTTATPIRTDGRGLGELFEAMVEWPSSPDLMDRGYLMRPRVYRPSVVDMRGAKKSGGDYNQKEAAERVDKAVLVGDIVETWRKHDGPRRPSVAFGVDCAHARRIHEEFRAASFRWAYVDGESCYLSGPEEPVERQHCWEMLRDGRVQGVSSVGVIGRGWDLPEVSCLIDAAPTASLARCLQKWGRCLRIAPGKTDAIILDHVGNWMEHGLPDEEREWSLEGLGPAAKREKKVALAIRACPKCWLTYRSTLPACPDCGEPAPIQERKIEQVEGELVEVTRESKARELLVRIQGHPKFIDLVEWRKTANLRGYKRGYPVVQFRAKHGHFPPPGWNDAAALLADHVAPPGVRPMREAFRDGGRDQRELFA